MFWAPKASKRLWSDGRRRKGPPPLPNSPLSPSSVRHRAMSVPAAVLLLPSSDEDGRTIFRIPLARFVSHVRCCRSCRSSSHPISHLPLRCPSRRPARGQPAKFMVKWSSVPRPSPFCFILSPPGRGRGRPRSYMHVRARISRGQRPVGLAPLMYECMYVASGGRPLHSAVFAVVRPSLCGININVAAAVPLNGEKLRWPLFSSLPRLRRGGPGGLGPHLLLCSSISVLLLISPSLSPSPLRMSFFLLPRAIMECQ